MIDFKNQVVIVTGAGRGLGKLYAKEIAKRGGAVVVNDLGASMDGSGKNTAVADEVVEEIRSAGGYAVASYDSVADPAQAKSIIRIAIDKFGRLDAVVSNAGIFGTAPFEDLSPDDWRRMLNVHLDGSFYLSQPAYRVMKSQRYGRFVFIASSAGMFGMPHEAHYGAAKGGIFGLSNVIAVEGAEHGILSNTVLPTGYTRMVSETINTEEGQNINQEAEAMQSPFFDAIDPGLVVPMVAYLASRHCEVSHHNYSACAGRFARVFVGLAEGWLAEKGAKPTADDIARYFEKVSATEPYSIPASIFDEVSEIFERRGLIF